MAIIYYKVGENIMILYYGPTKQLISGKPYGPGIKNFFTVQALKEEYSIKTYDTSDKSFRNRIKMFFSLLFSHKKTIVAVSSGGRKVIYPIVYLKKKLFKKFNYSLIVINGFILQEIEKNKKYIKYLKNASSVFVEIDDLRDKLEEIYGINNVFHFPNFKPDSHFVEEKEIANFKSENRTIPLKCAFLARVGESKGVIEAIEAVKRLNEENISVTLDIFGPVYNENNNDFEEIISSLTSPIKYCGIVASKDVTNVLKNYNLFLFPSKYKNEGFPASIVDAYSAGLPVISSDIAFLASIVKDGKNGKIINDVNVETVSSAIKEFYFDNVKLKEIAQTNFKESQKYRVSVVLRDLVNKFKQMGW